MSLHDQSEASDMIIEGKVIYKECIETLSGTFIHTLYTIDVTRILKGQLSSEHITIVESGGQIKDRVIMAQPAVTLETGQDGLFFISEYSFRDPSDQNKISQQLYRCVANAQSAFLYDYTTDRVRGIFETFPIESWYEELKDATGLSIRNIKPLTNPQPSNSRAMPTITSFTPTTINAGTGSELTINGSGFGESQGSSVVQFKNADDGGGTYMSASTVYTVSWSNTQIRLKVPFGAGTGTINVHVSGMNGTSANTLTIPYNILNGTTSTHYFVGFHRNMNGSGGLTLSYHNEFYNHVDARASFTRALNTWRCNTGMNFIAGPTTSVDVAAQDGTNVVRFDNGGELGVNTLGVCYWYNSTCGILLDPPQIAMLEFDLVFDDSRPWEYGPAAPSGSEIDFESVALHELGHGHLMGHVIHTDKVMHYLFGYGEMQRTLHADDIAAGNFVNTMSTETETYCDLSPTTDFRQVLYVDQSNTGSKTGDGWPYAFQDLQSALWAITTCVDTIYVAEGTYIPGNNENASFTIDNKNVVVMGGYPSGGGVRNMADNPTILSGDVDQNNQNNGSNAKNVLNLFGGAPVIDGFIIEDGYSDQNGGDNWGGGGLRAINSNCKIQNTLFRYNTIFSFFDVDYGGGVAVYGGSPSFYNVVFHDNSSFSATGSAIYSTGANLICNNCTFVNNPVAGVSLSGGTHQFRNSIFSNNGGEIIGSATVDISNSLFATSPGLGTGSNILLNTNPLFVDPVNFNFAILPCSPAVNSGNNSYNGTTVDVLGSARFVGTIDRGAYENTTGIPSTIVTNTSNTGTGSLRTILENCCDGNTITFNSSLSNQTIQLTSPIVINKNVNIHGLGMNSLTINGNGSHRMFTLSTGKTSLVKDLAITNGDAGSNGNVFLNNGTLTLQNVRLANDPTASNKVALLNASGSTTLKNTVHIE